MKQTAGFTVIELLIVSAIIGMLAAVLVPNLLDVRDKANLSSAASVARNILTGMAQVEVGGGDLAQCTYIASVVSITANGDTEKVNAPESIKNIQCSSESDKWKVTVTYHQKSGSATKDFLASK